MKKINKLLLLCSTMSLSMVCHADGLPQAVPSQGPQVMIYFRQPLWSPGAHRVYGLRIEQTSAPSTLPIGVGVNPLRRREIFNLELGQHSAMRVEFARRLIWDVNRQEFGLGSIRPNLAFQLSPRTMQPVGSPPQP
jgi:hypothetical protein